jgi:hypothetical protein
MSTELLNSRDQELTVDYVVEIRKLSVLDENRKPNLEPESEPKGITITV